MLKIFLGALALATAVQAGEVLNLKTGRYRLDSVSADSTGVSYSKTLKDILAGRMALTDRYFVVQYVHDLNSSQMAFYSNNRISVINYLPDDALLVRVSSVEDLRKIEHQQDLRAIVPYLPAWKLSPELALSRGNSELDIVVRLLDEGEQFNFENFLIEQGMPFTPLAEKTLRIQTSAGELAKLSSRQEVEWIEPWVPFTPQIFEVSTKFHSRSLSLTPTGYETGLKLLGIDEARKRGLNGQGQVVAIADSGVDTGELTSLHKDLKQIFKGLGLARQDKTWSDLLGHGTHVAGSIVSNGEHSGGLFQGAAFEARLFVEGIMADGGGLRNNSSRELLTPALAEGVHIHSNSWGALRTSYDAAAASYDEFIWKNPNLLVIFAAGNSGADLDRNGVVDENSVGSPGTAKNVLTVGASENLLSEGGVQVKMGEYIEDLWPVAPLAGDKFSDNPQGIAGFSSRGPTNDGRRKPDVVAPGTNILSTRSQMPDTSPMWGAYDANYIFSGGTSMATPIVAGVAALFRQHLVENLKISQPSAALLKLALMHTAEDLFPGQFGMGQFQEIPAPRPNNVEGFGRVSVVNFLTAGDLKLLDEKEGVASGESKTYPIQLQQGEKLIVTLNYTDAPGLVSSEKALVNDLDLIVQSPDGNMYQLKDRVNNQEHLSIQATQSGVYKVIISAVKVVKTINGKQSYALAVSRSQGSD